MLESIECPLNDITAFIDFAIIRPLYFAVDPGEMTGTAFGDNSINNIIAAVACIRQTMRRPEHADQIKNLRVIIVLSLLSIKHKDRPKASISLSYRI